MKINNNITNSCLPTDQQENELFSEHEMTQGKKKKCCKKWKKGGKACKKCPLM